MWDEYKLCTKSTTKFYCKSTAVKPNRCRSQETTDAVLQNGRWWTTCRSSQVLDQSTASCYSTDLHTDRQQTQLDVPTCCLSTIGGRAFPVAGAKVWNSLPSDVTSAPSLAVFKNRLKTYLFRRCYETVWLVLHFPFLVIIPPGTVVLVIVFTV